MNRLLKMENLSTKGKYTPTHELLLLPQLLGQLAGGDASVFRALITFRRGRARLNVSALPPTRHKFS